MQRFMSRSDLCSTLLCHLMKSISYFVERENYLNLVHQTTPLKLHEPADNIVICPIHTPLVREVFDGLLGQIVVRKLTLLP